MVFERIFCHFLAAVSLVYIFLHHNHRDGDEAPVGVVAVALSKNLNRCITGIFPKISGYQTSKQNTNATLLLLALILAGDISTNPGPRNASLFPCGVCDLAVTSDCRAVACDDCSVWYHRTCIDLCTADYDLLNHSNISWLCHKCDCMNCNTFTFRSYELLHSNYYNAISDPNVTLDSICSSSVFSPLKTSSPTNVRHNVSHNSHGPRVSTPSRTSGPGSSSLYHLPAKQNLRILSVNCRSIRNKSSEFIASIDYVKPDIVCGTESWLSDSIKSSEVFPQDYVAYRKDRQSAGGGVFILVHRSLVSVEQTNLDSNSESKWVDIQLENNKNLLVGVFYMPHRSEKDLYELNRTLQKISDGPNQKQVILAGDFNCPDIDWDTLQLSVDCKDPALQQSLIDISVSAELTQVHLMPTREHNILDLVFCSNPSLVKSSVSIPGISDHEFVVTDFDTKPAKIRQKPKRGYMFHKADWQTLNDEISSLSTTIQSDFATNNDVHSLWDTFKSGLMKSINSNIPSKMFKPRRSYPWINSAVRSMLKRKRRLLAQAKRTKNWANYRHFQKECRRHVRKAEWDHVNNIIQEGLSKNNSKPFWRYVKSKRQDNIGVAPLKSKGSLIADSNSKAKILLNQFKSVFTHESNSTLPPVSKNIRNPISNIKIDTNGIAKLLEGINPAKAGGPDDIPNLVLQKCATAIAPGLAAIFQKSLDSGDLPKDWLDANIAPVFKKGDKHSPENYRPISLTSVTCKILEHIICRHILSHFEQHKILTNLNHGFRSGFSCETQLAVTTHDLLQSFDKGKQVDVAILDFSKAFDTVPHNKLLHKLDMYGVRGPLHSWLRTFLCKRRMRVVLDGEYSEYTSVDSGVPQGTVLGPLLFLCHINDLPERVKSQVRLFADDCLLYRVINTFQDHIRLQEDLDGLERWATDWGMHFNSKKCYILSIKNKSQYFYSLDNEILQRVASSPYLGIQFSEDLKWQTHISAVSKKASSTLGFLRRNLRNCPQPCKRIAYISLVRSQLEYGASVWDPYLKTDIDRLEKIQRKAARFITGDYRTRVHGCVTHMLHSLKLPPLEDRRRDQRLVLLYKVSNGLLPAIPPHQFLTPKRKGRVIKAKRLTDYVAVNIVEKEVTNNSKCFLVPRCNTRQFEHSVFVRSTIDWNHLDEATVNASTPEGFVNALCAAPRA